MKNIKVYVSQIGSNQAYEVFREKASKYFNMPKENGEEGYDRWPLTIEGTRDREDLRVVIEDKEVLVAELKLSESMETKIVEGEEQETYTSDLATSLSPQPPDYPEGRLMAECKDNLLPHECYRAVWVVSNRPDDIYWMDSVMDKFYGEIHHGTFISPERVVAHAMKLLKDLIVKGEYGYSTKRDVLDHKDPLLGLATMTKGITIEVWTWILTEYTTLQDLISCWMNAKDTTQDSIRGILKNHDYPRGDSIIEALRIFIEEPLIPRSNTAQKEIEREPRKKVKVPIQLIIQAKEF